MVERNVYKDAGKVKKTYAGMSQKQYLKKNTDMKKGKKVLWIIPDFINKSEILDIKAEVKIRRKGGREDFITTEMYAPYPNKRIYHASVPGIYGVPVIYRTKEELETVASITVTWHILEGLNERGTTENSGRGRYLRATTVITEHIPEFAGEGTFYTLNLLDMTYETTSDKNLEETYYGSYDMAISYTAMDMRMNTEKKKDKKTGEKGIRVEWQRVDGQCYNFMKKGRGKLNHEEEAAFKKISEAEFDSTIMDEFLPYADDRDNVEREVVYLKRKTTLTGREYADISMRQINLFNSHKKLIEKQIKKKKEKNN